MQKPEMILKIATQIHMYGGDAIQYVKDHPDSFPQMILEAGDILLPLERKIPASIYIGIETQKLLVAFLENLKKEDMAQIEIGNFHKVIKKFMTNVNLGWNKEYLAKAKPG